MNTPAEQNPQQLAESLTGHRVRLTLTNGRTREGTIIGAGPRGFQITSGIGGRMLFEYGEVDAIDDLGTADKPVCTCPDIDVSPAWEPPGTSTVKGVPDARCGLHGREATR